MRELRDTEPEKAGEHSLEPVLPALRLAQQEFDRQLGQQVTRVLQHLKKEDPSFSYTSERVSKISSR